MAVNINVISQFDSKGLDQAQRDLEKLAQKTSNTSTKMSKAGGAIAASFAAIGGTMAAFAVDQTSELEDAHVQLENAFKNAGTSIDEHKNKLAKVSTQLEKYGYTNAQTEGAIARMTTVNGDAKKSMDLMGLAADVAKNRHVDLTKAGDLLAKTMAGSTTAAKKMGIAIPESVSNIQDPAQKSAAMLQLLQQHFKGSADAAAGTLKGKMDAAKASVSDMAAKLGEKLVPIVEKLVKWLTKAVDWLTKHKAALYAVAAIVGTVVLAVLVAYVAEMIMAAAATLAATWPILLIIAIIALLVGAVIYAYTHWGWFRKGVMAVWHAIQHAAKAAWNDFIKPVFHAIKNFIVNDLIPAWKKIWPVVKKVFGDVVDNIKTAWKDIKAVFKWVKDGVKTLIDVFGTIKDAVTTAFSTISDIITSPFKAAFNGIADLWNNTVGKLSWKVPSWVPIIGGDELSVPKIPKFKAMGGPVDGGSPYIVGEQGPELFVPRGSGTIVPHHAMGGNNITIHVHGADPQAVVNALRTWTQRNGSLAGAGVR
jgi:phage-related protein